MPAPLEPLEQLAPDGRPLDPGYAAYDPTLGPPPAEPVSGGRKAGGIIMIVLGSLCALAFLAGLANPVQDTGQLDAAVMVGMWIGRLLVLAAAVLLIVFGIRLTRPRRKR